MSKLAKWPNSVGIQISKDKIRSTLGQNRQILMVFCPFLTGFYPCNLGCLQNLVIGPILTLLNITKKRNWYIMSPMKIPKQQFYNFCMKFSISKHHRRRNFLAFQLREGRKRSGKFTANPDYTFYRLWIPRLLQSLFLVNSQENQQKFKFSFPLSAARNW